MSLLDLSNELLIKVCQFVDSPTDLSTLSLCCQRIHSLAVLILYQTIVLPKDESLIALIRTILAQPYLARYVRTFINSGGYSSWPARLDIEKSMSDDDKVRFSRAVECLGVDSYGDELNSSEWSSDIESGSWDAAFAMVLCLLPNVESIHLAVAAKVLEDEEDYPTSKIDAVIRRAGRLQESSQDCSLALRNLRTVSLTKENNSDGLYFQNFFPYIALKSVTKFLASKINDCMLPEDLQRGMTSSPSLEHGIERCLIDDKTNQNFKKFKFKATSLSLTRCSLQPRALKQFLQNFPALTHFEYENGDDGLLVVPPMILEGLCPSIHSLEKLLLIDSERYHPLITGIPEAFQVIGSIRNFEKLKALIVSEYILVGQHGNGYEIDPSWDSNIYSRHAIGTQGATAAKISQFLANLPPSLEELTLLDCSVARIYPYVIALIQYKQQYTPSLARLTLNFSYEPMAGPDKFRLWNDLWEKCGKLDFHKIKKPRGYYSSGYPKTHLEKMQISFSIA